MYPVQWMSDLFGQEGEEDACGRGHRIVLPTATLLQGIPAVLRDDLLERYREIARNYREHRWEPAELNGGKFAEVVYSIAHGAVTGVFPASAHKPADFAGSCRALEGMVAKPALVGDRTLRVLIPRQLVALYEIRNNRGVGHVGGEVSPNNMDAMEVYSTASWVLAELIRVFHGCTVLEAQEAVDALAERTTPAVWVVPGTTVKRVLESSMSAANQVLLLLHVAQGWLAEAELLKSVEYGRLADFRKVLRRLHEKRLVEYDVSEGRVHLTSAGATLAENLLG